MGKAIASVIAEPLVMAVAAVGLGAIASGIFYLTDLSNQVSRIGSGPLWTLGLLAVWIVALRLLHPRWLNSRLEKMSKLKLNSLKLGLTTKQEPKTVEMRSDDAGRSFVPGEPESDTALKLKQYPLRPLLGEIGFVLWRSLGFIATVMALTTLTPTDWPLLVSAFSRELC